MWGPEEDASNACCAPAPSLVLTVGRRCCFWDRAQEVVEKDLLIQEKDKLYVELKNILARQPGPEVAEQLSIYQQGLRDRTKSMKAMASELNMYQAQVRQSARTCKRGSFFLRRKFRGAGLY